MGDLYVYTIFNKNGTPRYTVTRQNNIEHVIQIYRPGAHKTIGIIEQTKKEIRDKIVNTVLNKHNVIINDFKSHIKQYKIVFPTTSTIDVYDINIDNLQTTDNDERDVNNLKALITKISSRKPKIFEKLFANAAVVYQYLEDRGLLNNDVKVSPHWSLKTFSGRAKSSNFNIQGFTDNHVILPPGLSNDCVLIHFDWVCADIRVASILSGDKVLERSFKDSDPYTFIMNEINNNSVEKLTRDECKLLLLKSINSMDFNNDILLKIYQKLGMWIADCSSQLNRNDGYLETLLGKKFKISNSKNSLAVLNGIMQGSVAHGMQNVLRKTWERIGTRVVADIHDSLVVASPPSEIKATIDLVVKYMTRPFEGLLPSNPYFPLKVSIGKKWRMWKLLKSYNDDYV